MKRRETRIDERREDPKRRVGAKFIEKVTDHRVKKFIILKINYYIRVSGYNN